MRTTLKAVAALLPLCGAMALSAATASPDRLEAALSAASVSYLHVTPRGRLALLGAAVHTGPVLTRYRFAEVLSDDDGDGAVVFTPRGGVPLRSAWIAVDLSTGAVAVTAPEDYDLDRAEMDRKTLKRDAGGLVSALEWDALSVELLLVRPGDGAWLLRGHEGGPKDRDGARNARLTIEPGDAEPLRGIDAAAPKKLKAGDVLIALDPVRLTVRTLTLTQ